MKKALLISCFDWYDTRLAPIRNILNLNYGFDVICVTSDYHHINKQTILNKNENCLYVHVPAYKKNLSISRIRSHLSFGNSVKRLLDKEKPDLIYLLLPPNNTAIHCLKYKELNPSTMLVIDIIDLWPESMPLDRFKSIWLMRYWRDMRDKALKKADFVFTECALYQEKLKPVLVDKNHVQTLHLFKKTTGEYIENVQKSINSRIIKTDAITLGYVGSINSIVDIAGICDTVLWLRKNYSEVIFHIIGDGSSREEFLKRVKETGCDVKYHGKVFDDFSKISILGQCDLAFNMMISNISVGLTIKSIDYFSIGLPLLNNIKGDTWKIVEDYRLGINIDGQNMSKEMLELLRTETSHKSVLDYFVKNFTLDSFQHNVEEGLNTILKEEKNK